MKKQKPTTIMISGYYGFGNAGDEAILAAIIQELKAGIPDVEIIVLSESPDSTTKEHGVLAHDRKDYFGIYKLMGEIDLLLSGGGGLIQDVTGFTTVVYYLSIVYLALMRRKKVMLFAQGLGPVRLGKSKMIARHIMNKVSLISYRDEKSKKLSKEIGISTPPIFVTADPVFALKPAPGEILDPIVQELGITRDSLNIGISIRPWVAKTDYINIVSQVADMVAKEHNANVYLFPFQESQDTEPCKKILTKMVHRTKLVPRTYSIPAMMGLLGKMDMILGMRLHSLIFAAVQNIPAVGISYDPKVTNLMDYLELPYIKINRLSFDQLLETVNETITNREKIKKALPEKINVYKEEALRNFELVKALV